MLYAFLKSIHVLSIAIWIGGMVFTQFFLRPALSQLEPPARVRFMQDVLGRFLNAMAFIAALAIGSGGWMVGRIAMQNAQAGTGFSMPVEWMVMAALGIIMLGVLIFIRCVLYLRLSRAVSASAWAVGGAVLAHIRTGVFVNLMISVVIVFVTLLGAAG